MMKLNVTFCRISQLVLWLPCILLFVSCDQFMNLQTSSSDYETCGLNVHSMTISDDTKHISLNLAITDNLGKYELADSTQVRMKVRELKRQLIPWSKQANPYLVSISNIVAGENAKLGLKLLLMVDLCQSPDVLERERDYINSLVRLYGKENVFISFILSEGELSPIMEVTSYVIENYVNGNSKYRVLDSETPPYVYRALYFMLGKLRNGTETPLDSAAHRAIVMLSNSPVYDEMDNTPLDPDHYWVQAQILQQLNNASFPAPAIYYVRSGETGNDMLEMDESSDDKEMMQVFCQQSGGAIMNGFNAVELRKHNFSAIGTEYADYAVELENPDGKFYYGSLRRLEMSFYNRADSLLARCSKEYARGSIVAPILVGNKSLDYIASRGFIIALLALLIVFVVLQLLVPYVRYLIFRRKNVVTYTGPRMSVNAIAIPDECYYCKAPFVVGERIVAKCSHVMHLECWNENGYHCPEHGKHCPEGSHYYNGSNLFDRRNAPLFMRWIIVSILTTSFSWFLFLDSHLKIIFYELFDSVEISLLGLNEQGVSPFSPEDADVITARLYLLPCFGCLMGFALTFAFSIYTSHKYNWHIRLLGQFIRANVALVLTFFVFVFNNAILAVLNLYDGSLILDWIPWVLTSLIIVFVSTYHSRLRVDKRKWLRVVVVGAVSTLFWGICAEMQTIDELMKLLVVIIAYAVALAASIAQFTPVGKHFFLHVSGPIKEMDIALYKWLRASPNAIVTIGKSVDCALQLTWDLQSDVAPMQINIYKKHGVIRIRAVDGVTLKGGRQLVHGKEYRIFHGDSFQIGQTTFRLVEI